MHIAGKLILVDCSGVNVHDLAAGEEGKKQRGKKATGADL